MSVRVTLLDLFPVDDVPDGVEVLSLAVLVLQVVGVLPGVDGEQGHEAGARDNGVLVGRGADRERSACSAGGVRDQEGPAGALDACEDSVYALLERVVGAELGRYGAAERRVRRGAVAATLGRGREVGPEHAVVDEPSAVELHVLLQARELEHELGVARSALQRALCLGHLLQRGVQPRRIRLVVLRVVQLVDLACNVGFQRPKVPLQLGQRHFPALPGRLQMPPGPQSAPASCNSCKHSPNRDGA